MGLSRIQTLIDEADASHQKNDTALLGTLAKQAKEEIEKYKVQHPYDLSNTHQLYARAMFFVSVYHAIKGQMDDSVREAQLALEILDMDDKPELRARLYHLLGETFRNLSDFTKALQHEEQSLKIWQSLGNEHGVNTVLNSISASYYYLGEYELALQNLQAVTKYFEQVNDAQQTAATLGNLALAYTALGKNDEALQHLERAMQMNKALGNKKFIAINAYSIGGVYLTGKEFQKAKEYLELALELSADMNNAFSAALFALGGLYKEEMNPFKDYQTALNYMQRAVKTAEESHDLIGLSHSYFGLAETFVLLHDFENAFKYHKLGYETERKVKSEEAKREATQIDHRRKVENAERDRQLNLARFQEQEKILLNILPAQIAEQIISGTGKIIQRFDSATVLFADVVGFTKWSEGLSLDEVAETLNHIFNLFDELANEYGVEKIKTIGDAYMCVAGLPEPCDDHAERMAKMALAMNQKIAESYPSGEIKLRIGIHCGEVIAGVIGKNKYAYDLWGDTVNTASRMESHGVENKIQVSEEFRNQLGDKFSFEERGEIDVKGKGKMKTWFLNPPTRS